MLAKHKRQATSNAQVFRPAILLHTCNRFHELRHAVLVERGGGEEGEEEEEKAEWEEEGEEEEKEEEEEEFVCWLVA